MDRLHIRWDGPHHTGDDTSLLRDAIAIADDEGPIILVPNHRRGRAKSKAALAYGTQVFESMSWLISHIAVHGEDLDCEFMLGICEDVPQDRRDLAISGLCRIGHFLNKTAGFARKQRVPGTAQTSVKNWAEMKHGTVSDAPVKDFSLRVENGGDSYEEIARLFPDLLPNMLILAS